MKREPSEPTDSQIGINRASERDRPRILGLMRQHDGDFSPPLSHRVDLDEWLEKLSSHGIVLVAAVDGVIAGFAAFYANASDRGVSFLSLVLTGAGFRKHGIGELLIERWKSHARAAGFQSLRLEVNAADDRLIKWYRRQGFHTVRRYDRYGHDALLLGMDIVMTPTVFYPRLSEALGVRLWIKHDDAFPVAGGGNKARKIGPILDRARTELSDSVVTAGAAGSNHARVVALMAARLGWKCRIVVHDRPEVDHPNLRIMRLAGAELVFTELETVAPVMDEQMDRLTKEGHRPFYIWGGGHLLEGGLAYYQAYAELLGQLDLPPHYIVLASGTGTTQAGLHAAALMDHRPVRVLGVSVARERERGKAAVRHSVVELLTHLGRSETPDPVQFRDEWTEGGYGRFGRETLEVIAWAARTEGVILDPVYTAKAFRGLRALVSRREIPANSRVVFWHTGGTLNLAGCPEVGRA